MRTIESSFIFSVIRKNYTSYYRKNLEIYIIGGNRNVKNE